VDLLAQINRRERLRERVDALEQLRVGELSARVATNVGDRISE
jgi:hypothetical protein